MNTNAEKFALLEVVIGSMMHFHSILTVSSPNKSHHCDLKELTIEV